MSLYGRLVKLDRKGQMYADMLARAIGTPAEAFIVNELGHTRRKIMEALGSRYENNMLFRDCIKSDDDDFLLKTYLSVEKVYISDDSARDTMIDINDLAGLFGNLPKKLMVLDRQMPFLRSLMEEYRVPVSGKG